MAFTTVPVYDTTYKPLVLVVRSPHLKPVSSIQERDAMLAEIDDTAYMRSFITAYLARLYSPVNIFIDGVDKDFAENIFNPMCATIAMTGLKRAASSLRNIRAINRTSDTGLDHGIELSTLKVPSPKYFRETMLEGRYFMSSKDFRPEDLVMFGEEIPEQIIELGNFEIDRLAHMMAIPAYYCADISFVETEQDMSLVRENLKAEYLGDLSKAHRFARIREGNIYQLAVEQAEKSGRNSIVYLGSTHEPPSVEESDHLDIAHLLIDGKSPITVTGDLPFEDMYGGGDTFTHILENGPLEIAVDVNFRRFQKRNPSSQN